MSSLTLPIKELVRWRSPPPDGARVLLPKLMKWSSRTIGVLGGEASRTYDRGRPLQHEYHPRSCVLGTLNRTDKADDTEHHFS